MEWNKSVRQVHGWLSLAFTLAVIVNLVAVGRGAYAAWVGLLALIGLVLLMLTDLYLFVLPYATTRHRASHQHSSPGVNTIAMLQSE